MCRSITEELIAYYKTVMMMMMMILKFKMRVFEMKVANK